MTMIASGVDEQGALSNDEYTKTTDDYLQKMTTKTAIAIFARCHRRAASDRRR